MDKKLGKLDIKLVWLWGFLIGFHFYFKYSSHKKSPKFGHNKILFADKNGFKFLFDEKIDPVKNSQCNQMEKVNRLVKGKILT